MYFELNSFIRYRSESFKLTLGVLFHCIFKEHTCRKEPGDKLCLSDQKLNKCKYPLGQGNSQFTLLLLQ